MKLNKKGFSLIELSIVLIIIGLLVAGVTGGASLIKSAELRAVVSEIRSYQTAVNAYFTSTGCLPGKITTAGVSNCPGTISFGLTRNAWIDLADEGIVDLKPVNDTVLTVAATSIDPDDGLPSRSRGSFYALGSTTDMGNVLFLLSSTGTDATVAALEAAKSPTTGTTLGVIAGISPAINGKDAKFLDEKLDNGNALTGKVQSFSAGEAVCNYETDTVSCVTAFKIGI